MILIRIHFNSIRVSLKNRDSLRNKQTNKQNKKRYTTKKKPRIQFFRCRRHHCCLTSLLCKYNTCDPVTESIFYRGRGGGNSTSCDSMLKGWRRGQGISLIQLWVLCAKWNRPFLSLSAPSCLHSTLLSLQSTLMTIPVIGSFAQDQEWFPVAWPC